MDMDPDDRRNRIGASDVAAACGLSPWSTPIDLWQLKTGRVNPPPASWRMRAGTLLEPLVLDAYTEATGRQVIAHQHQFGAEPHYLRATLDGLTECGRVVEAKTASNMAGWGDDGTADVPDHYAAQVQAQMHCTGSTVADLPVLFNLATFRVYTVARDDAAIDAILERLARFWWCVQQDTPPDWGRLDAAALAILHPQCSGETILPDAVLQDADEYTRVGQEIAAAETYREHLRDNVLAAMGEAEFGQLSDGRRIRRYRQEVAAVTRQTTVKAHVRHYFRVLKRSYE
jgi:putative phage-type endonuclease